MINQTILQDASLPIFVDTYEKLIWHKYKLINQQIINMTLIRGRISPIQKCSIDL